MANVQFADTKRTAAALDLINPILRLRGSFPITLGIQFQIALPGILLQPSPITSASWTSSCVVVLGLLLRAPGYASIAVPRTASRHQTVVLHVMKSGSGRRFQFPGVWLPV